MTHSEHLSKQFDSDLEEVRSRVLQMGGLVEAQILTAIECFTTGDHDKMAQVVESEFRVNAYEVEIDDMCVHIVARRQPTAGDLRLIMGVSKTVTDLERIGDEAEKIARMAGQIHERRGLQIPRSAEVRRSGEMAVAQLRRALDAMARLDPDEAERIIGEDAAHRRRIPQYPAPAHHLHDGGSAHHLDGAGDRLDRQGHRAHRRSREEHRRTGHLHRARH